MSTEPRLENFPNPYLTPSPETPVKTQESPTVLPEQEIVTTDPAPTPEVPLPEVVIALNEVPEQTENATLPIKDSAPSDDFRSDILQIVDKTDPDNEEALERLANEFRNLDEAAFGATLKI